MARRAIAKIEFYFDEHNIREITDNHEVLTDQDMIDYATETFIEDLFQMMKYNDLGDAVKVHIEEIEETTN